MSAIVVFVLLVTAGLLLCFPVIGIAFVGEKIADRISRRLYPLVYVGELAVSIFYIFIVVELWGRYT